MSGRESAPQVGIIMGSDSDIKGVMQRAEEPLQAADIGFEHGIKSAHRTPDVMSEYARTAEERGLKVIIAGAGGSAHLPGMVASETTLPVLGVAVTKQPEVMNRALGSLIGMPEGKPLATFQTGSGAFKAGTLAVKILVQLETGASRIGIVMNSEHEAETMAHASRALTALGFTDGQDYEQVFVATHQDVKRYSQTMAKNYVGVVIAASTADRNVARSLIMETTIPILGVAITSNPDIMNNNLDDLVNSPEDEPFAAFQAGAGAFNAGLFAGRIVALGSADVRAHYRRYDLELARTVSAKDFLYGRMSTAAYLELAKDPDALKEAVEGAPNLMNNQAG